MPEKQPSAIVSNVHTVYAIIFGVLAVGSLLALVAYRSLIDTSDQSATPTNSAPTVTVFTSTATDVTTYNTDSGGIGTTGIALSDGINKTIYIHGTATDLNGCGEITKTLGTYTAKVYRTAAAGVGATATCGTADNNYCYNVAEDVLTVDNDSCTSGTTVKYEFAVPITYWGDPTDTGSAYASDSWTSRVDVTDVATGTNSGTDLFEIAAGPALSATATINFSDNTNGTTLALGYSPALGEEDTMTITNTGNTQMDLALRGTDFTCLRGTSMVVGQSKYSTAATVAYAAQTALTTSDVTDTAFNLAARTDESTASTKSVYWKIAIPESSVSGACTSTITVTAAAG